MEFFKCCHHCKVPKRHPGCHSTCPDYFEAKKSWDEHKEIENQARIKDSTIVINKKRKIPYQ